MTRCEVEVVGALGLHARAAAAFVNVASRFESRIQVARGARAVDGKSILGLLFLAAARGSRLVITADGPDEAAAAAAVVALVTRGFEAS